ncbi:cysteine-rich repeat secretory protein 38-like [Vicia villosa]|uniref:cysteine-rich repeat secretory protein 38-like n=1 Tax=Vicia villosa TaxID=3911 RepID=UPI00273C9249|nr:cysteine-rich repeat secretory protein 38-like [Vicia villosa]
MASISFHFSLFLLIITIFSSSKLANAANNTQNFHYFCDFNNRGNFTNNSTYQTNLKTLLSTLTSNTQINYGFYNFSNGQTTNKVNAIALCRGDVKNQNDCLSCLKASSNNLTQLCPNQKEAIGWYEDEKCMLRYSDRSIFNLEETGPAYFAWNSKNATNEDEFDKKVKNLLDGLRNKASSNDLKYAVGSDKFGLNNNETLYGLVQCTPDLSKTSCDDCLVQSIKEVPNCCNNRIGARIVRPSCNLRYEINSPFYHTTTPDSTSPSPSPSPPSTVPPLTAPPPFAQNTASSPSSDKGNTSRNAAGIIQLMLFILSSFLSSF